MRAMKDSGIEWIGQIPQDWQIAKVKHVYSFQTGWTPSTSNAAYFDGDLPWANISDIGKTKTIYDTAKHITEEAVANSSMGISPKGSLMYSFKLSVGDVSFCGTDMYTNEAIATFLPSDKYDLRYLYYAAPLFIIKNANENIYGAKLLNQELIRNALILNPPYNEQVSVADYLDAKCAEIDALIAAKEKTNALLKERRQSIIYEAVTKGLNPDAPMKDSQVFWIGHIPSHWDVTRLKFYATIRTGFTLGKRYDASEELQEYPYLRVANVQGEYTDLTNVATIHMPASEADQHKLHAGELLMTEGGDRDKLGRGSVWRGEIHDCLHQNHVFALATKEQLNVEYLSYLTTSSVGRDYFDFTAKKTTNLASTNATTILEFKIPFPSREVQDQIVAFLNAECGAIDELIVRNDDTIAALKEYRQSIIYETVTGKIEI